MDARISSAASRVPNSRLDDVQQRGWAHRLEQIVLEYRVRIEIAKLLQAVATHRDQHRLPGSGLLLERAPDFEAIHSRQTDIDDDCVRLEPGSQCNTQLASRGCEHGMARSNQAI